MRCKSAIAPAKAGTTIAREEVAPLYATLGNAWRCAYPLVEFDQEIRIE